MTRVDSLVPLMHHDPDRSWITDPDPDHPKGTQPISNGTPEMHSYFNREHVLLLRKHSYKEHVFLS